MRDKMGEGHDKDVILGRKKMTAIYRRPLLITRHESRTPHHASLSMATQHEPAAREAHFVAFVVNAVKRHVDLAAGAIAEIDTERLAARFAVRGNVIASLPAGIKQPNEVC